SSAYPNPSPSSADTRRSESAQLRGGQGPLLPDHRVDSHRPKGENLPAPSGGGGHFFGGSGSLTVFSVRGKGFWCRNGAGRAILRRSRSARSDGHTFVNM